MASEIDYKVEDFQSYHGDPMEVKKQIDDCPMCQTKLLFNHLPDYRNLLIQETSRCLNCGHHNKKLIHKLN